MLLTVTTVQLTIRTH